MIKTLIVFYSRTGTTKKLAQKIQARLNCDSEEIFTERDRRGPIGYLLSGREAMKKQPAKIKPTMKNPADYDLVIAGGPIWSFSLSSPIRTYLTQNKNKFKKLAFFCTMGGSEPKGAFDEMETASGQKPIAALGVKTKEVLNENFENQLNEFIKSLSF